MYNNVKSGLNKLFIAELLAIASTFTIVFNGESIMPFGFALQLLGAVAFFLKLNGLKQCAYDDNAYRKPRNLAVAAFFVCLVVTILGGIFVGSAISKSVNEIQSVFNYLVAYSVLKATAPILRECGKEAEAAYADEVRKIYTISFVVSELLSITTDASAGAWVIAGTAIVALAAVIALLIAQIRYIIFLNKSSAAL